MPCKNCPDKIHPIFIIIAVLTWIMIICGLIKILWMIGFMILLKIGVGCLILKLCYSAGEIDNWYNSIKKG